jgi:hypothetical protein
MKTRSIALAAVAFVATSTALADAPAATVGVQQQPTPRAQTVMEELADDMREILRAVTPEISLPTIEIKLPTLDARR